MILQTFIKINGYYDIICGCSILNMLPLNHMRIFHINMFKQNNSSRDRILGYFIMLYGIIRTTTYYDIIYLSYILEASYFINELSHSTVYFNKSIFVIISCFIIAIQLYNYAFNEF